MTVRLAAFQVCVSSAKPRLAIILLTHTIRETFACGSFNSFNSKVKLWDKHVCKGAKYECYVVKQNFYKGRLILEYFKL